MLVEENYKLATKIFMEILQEIIYMVTIIERMDILCQVMNLIFIRQSFYLEEGKICYAGPGSDYTIEWIMIDDIEDLLKVPKW